MKQKIEYQINKHTPLVEELINIENSISNVFDGYSELYKQYKQKFTEACNIKDVTIINQSQESESLQEDSDEYYTKLISKDLGPAVQEFMNSSEVNGQQIRDAVIEFFDEYNKIPSKGMDSLDIKYDCDKDRFYQKYKPFVDKCKEVSNKLRPTGYGKTDYFDIKAKELLKKVDYNFPYGWKVYKGVSERQSVAEDIDSTLAARERRDRIEYLKNQIKEETKDWQTKFGDKGSVDIFKENDKKIRYAISPFVRQDNGESLDVIEKTFKEIIRKTNKYFNLEGTEKFRLKLNPMFVTIICP